ncbi:hypothetical protein [Clostridium sp.]|uniref:hypothetical protein n=1 Tax=Clostridium sp. TaxID=1506 RepID=UPI003D6C833B
MQKKLIISIPIFMILGITVGSIFNVAFFKQWIMPLTFLMVYPMMVTLNVKILFNNPMLIIRILFPLILLYLFNFIFSTVVARMMFNKEDDILLVYGTVMRNLSLCLAIAMTAFKEQGT